MHPTDVCEHVCNMRWMSAACLLSAAAAAPDAAEAVIPKTGPLLLPTPRHGVWVCVMKVESVEFAHLAPLANDRLATIVELAAYGDRRR
jgi:hypothetical protein